MSDTIVALSSGLVPSGVAVIRVSGPQVRVCLQHIAGRVPAARVATLRTLKDGPSGAVLDKALVLFFPCPESFTGEDVAEFHCHGGRAVVQGVLSALISVRGVRAADAGDFTRQAFSNGKLDLTQVEAVGDLIHANTQAQRDQAVQQLDGAGRRQLALWRDEIATCRALIEADLDFSDEEDVPGSVIDSLPQRLAILRAQMDAEAESRLTERVRDGFRVVLVGPPNSGKSTLLNALLARDAALVSPIAGTTRDQMDVPIDLDGLPVVLSDTAGLRRDSSDVIEQMGMERTQVAMAQADLCVWLVGQDEATAVPEDRQALIRIRSKSDLLPDEASRGDTQTSGVDLQVSGKTGAGLAVLRKLIAERLRAVYAAGGTSVAGQVALDPRRRAAVVSAAGYIRSCEERLQSGALHFDQAAEDLRLAQRSLGSVTGDVDVEGVLDIVFSRFCIGK